MSIDLSIYNIIFKVFNSENKSKLSRSNKSSYFKYFLGLGIFLLMKEH